MMLSSSTGRIPAARLLLKYLEAQGVKYVFGIPGGPLTPFYEALHGTPGILTVLTKHEEGAAFMADGYARMRRGLGACFVTSGPGCTNAATGIATAFSDGIPIFLITAQVATSAFGRGAIQESGGLGINVVEMFKTITKASLMLTRADKMGETVRHLLRVALSGKPGPVHLNVPADLANELVLDEPALPLPGFYRPSYFSRDSVRQASRILCRAQNPAILAGHGVNLSGAYEELKCLSERLDIPVATTAKAKGAFPEDHALSMGVFGFASSPKAEAYLLSGQVDVLLAVGTGLGEDATNVWDKRLKPRDALIQIDVDPAQIGKNYPAAVGLLGDAKTNLTELSHQIERDLRWMEAPPRGGENVRKFLSGHPWCVQMEKMSSEQVPLKPQRLMRDLEEALPENAAVFSGIGDNMAWALHYLKVPRPHSIFHCIGFAAMGYGTTACIGAKLAAPGRPVIAVVGDAGFAMNGMEVHTACEYNIPVIWLVLNNGGHGMVYHGENLLFGRKFNYSLFRHPLNITQLASSLGALSFRVTQPGEIQGRVEECLKRGRPAVIEAMVDPEEIPPIGARVRVMDQYINQLTEKLV